MLVSIRALRCLAASLGLLSLGSSGCAAVVSNDDTMAELGRLRAAVRQGEERMAAMQAHQYQLSQQLAVLSTFVGAMAARRDDTARKKENFMGNAAATVSMPAEPAQPVLPVDLEF